MGKQAPAGQDYQQAAKQQEQSSQANVAAQTQANRPDTSGPFASQNWTQGPDGSWQLQQGFTGPLAGAANSLGQAAADAYGKPMDDGSAVRQQVTDAAYRQAVSRLDPQWAQRQEGLTSQLANQGLDPNSAAARAAQREMGQQRNDAYTSAMASAIANGNQAQALTFQQNMAARNNPLQQLESMQGLLGGPSFHAAGAAESGQYLPATIAVNNYALNAWNATNQANADAITGGAKLAGSLIPFAF